jgi:endonuclease YncB( thermonuclease family)
LALDIQPMRLYNFIMIFNHRLFVFLTFIAAAHLVACVAGGHEAKSGSQAVLTGKARVYDGDSIFFGSIEVRLDAIDAPERDQACLDAGGRFWPCGIAARDALRAMIGNGEVNCSLSGRDKYRRLLGICTVQGRDLNAAMVESGNAIAYRYFSERYARQEDQAKAGKAGIWQDAHFTEPYFCRHFAAGHTCYEYDYAAGTGRVAAQPLIGKSHAVDVPN